MNQTIADELNSERLRALSILIPTGGYRRSIRMNGGERVLPMSVGITEEDGCPMEHVGHDKLFSSSSLVGSGNPCEQILAIGSG